MPAVVEDPLMRPSASSMDSFFPNASRFLSTYIIHVNAALSAINVAVERDSTVTTPLWKTLKVRSLFLVSRSVEMKIYSA